MRALLGRMFGRRPDRQLTLADIGVSLLAFGPCGFIPSTRPELREYVVRGHHPGRPTPSRTPPGGQPAPSPQRSVVVPLRRQAA